MEKVFWIACYIVGGIFGLIAVGGWAYAVYNGVRMGMLGRSRTLAQSWPYICRFLIGAAIMTIASIMGSFIFNPAAEQLFGP